MIVLIYPLVGVLFLCCCAFTWILLTALSSIYLLSTKAWKPDEPLTDREFWLAPFTASKTLLVRRRQRQMFPQARVL